MPQLDLARRFPFMTPVNSPPPMFRLNGCGVALYGKRDHDAETNSFVATWCLAILFIPVFCLRAYRVAHAPRGWYFLGREPLSSLAKGWNVVLAAAIAVTVGVVQYSIYTSSPSYKAKQQMAAAHSLVDQGHLAKAARIYQTLAVTDTDQADNAALAVRDLLANQCNQAPLADTAGVVASAVQVARRGHVISLPDVADRGLKLVAEKGDSDPRAGVAVLDAIRPLVIDTRPVDERRLALLRKRAASEPTNLDVIAPFASLLEQRGQLAEAKKLLVPMQDRIGNGEAARVLGTILGREGDFDGAYALLWPYVQTRLESLHAAEKEAEDTGSRLWEREVKLLQDNKAPADFYQSYHAAGKDQQRAMVRRYVNGRIKNDPSYLGTQEALEREAHVVPVALELGIVMLQRAQAQADPNARKSQLESAEKVFLAIGGIAGESDAYRLSLAQVDYWLGKQSDGRKLFDEFLATKARDVASLLEVSAKLRELGADPDSRSLSEEAYNKAAKPEDRYQAAYLRALCFKNLDDHIAWLQRSDTTTPGVKASLAAASGEKAFEEGRDDDAVRQYRTAVDAYGQMPRSPTTLNDSALAYYSIFRATGDGQALERCGDCFQQAVDLKPSDPILLFNAGATLIEGAVADVIGDAIDLRTLHQTGDVSLLRYLYHDQSGRDDVVRRVKSHPGIVRAMSYLDKATVLSPRNERAWGYVDAIHSFTRNGPALSALEKGIATADIDSSDQLSRLKEFLGGVKDNQNKTALAASIKRARQRLEDVRAKGGLTAALALDQQAEQMMTLDLLDGSADAHEVVVLAQQASQLSPSVGTGNLLTAALLFHAAKDIRHADPAFNAFCEKYMRSLGPSYLMAVVAAEPGAFQSKVLANPHLREALDLIREDGRLFSNWSPYEWAILKNSDAAEAQKAAITFAAPYVGTSNSRFRGCCILPIPARRSTRTGWRRSTASSTRPEPRFAMSRNSAFRYRFSHEGHGWCVMAEVR